MRKTAMLLLLALVSCQYAVSKPRQVIFDTDWWTDVDDACAVRLLLDAASAGQVDLKGICLSALCPTSARSFDSFLKYEGCSGLPLAADFDATDYTGRPSYHQTVISGCGDPSARSNEDCEGCVSFYRRILSQSRGRVDIIAVGYPNTLAKLLQSCPDEYSRLSGRRLVRRKVGRLWMMAGLYPNGRENNFCRTERSRLAGAQVCAEWPTEIIFLGYEVGIQVRAGGRLPADDLLHQVLKVHGSAGGRYAWDPMTTLMAVSGSPEAEGYHTVRGTNVVNPEDGSNVFTVSKRGRHSYVVMDFPAQWYADRLDGLLSRE